VSALFCKDDLIGTAPTTLPCSRFLHQALQKPACYSFSFSQSHHLLLSLTIPLPFKFIKNSRYLNTKFGRDTTAATNYVTLLFAYGTVVYAREVRRSDIQIYILDCIWQSVGFRHLARLPPGSKLGASWELMHGICL
jgi:hypothetical protein